MRTTGITAAAFAIALVSGLAHALPDTVEGLSIGGAIVDGTGTPQINLSRTYDPIFAATYPDVSLCYTSFLMQTGSATNSFFNNADLSSCSALIGNGATYGLFGGISTTLKGELTAGAPEVVEITKFSRAAPNAPISLRFEPYGVIYDSVIQVTPSIVDQIGNVLETGRTVNAASDGLGPVGGSAFVVTLDAVSDHVVAANVDRWLKLTIVSDVPGRNEIVRFPLTVGTNEGECVELLHIGPAVQANPIAAINVTFGCAAQAPPPTCVDEAASALAASRDYQKATRDVNAACGRRTTANCENALLTQETAFNALAAAQQRLSMYCGM